MEPSSTLAPLPDSSVASSLSLNQPLIVAFISFAMAQGLKILAVRYKEQRWYMIRLLGSNVMPSSHVATVMGLATAIGLKDGLGGSLFAIAVVLASVVMYDSSGVKLQAGHQAKVLNQIVVELPPEHPLSTSIPLGELLGHTPFQVVTGALLGCLVAFCLHIVLFEIDH